MRDGASRAFCLSKFFTFLRHACLISYTKPPNHKAFKRQTPYAHWADNKSSFKQFEDKSFPGFEKNNFSRQRMKSEIVSWIASQIVLSGIFFLKTFLITFWTPTSSCSTKSTLFLFSSLLKRLLSISSLFVTINLSRNEKALPLDSRMHVIIIIMISICMNARRLLANWEIWTQHQDVESSSRDKASSSDVKRLW